MTDIPDDVVQRALDAWFGDLGWKHDKSLGIDAASSDGWRKERMRAAGRVFVEWERGECAKLAEAVMLPFSLGGDLILDPATADTIAENIRSRSAD